MKKRVLSALLTLCMMLTMAPVTAFAADPDGSENNPFTSVSEYNTAVAGTTWDGQDVYLTISDTEFNSTSNPFNLTNVQSRVNPPKLHLTLTGCKFTGNTSGENAQTGNPSFMYLPNCQELKIDGCTFDSGSDTLTYGINWNLIQIQDATVSITNCTFNGEYEENAIKLNQRNGSDDTATDVKGNGAWTETEIIPASIASATISGCTFENPDKAIILLGSAGKNNGAAAPSTGAFPVTIKAAEGNYANVFLAYLASEQEALAAMQHPDQAVADGLAVRLTEGQTVTKAAKGDPITSQDQAVAQINEEGGFLTLANAILAAENDDKITVLKENTFTEPITIDADKDITLDLNGKKVSYNTDSSDADYRYALTLTGGAELTIEDSVGGGELTSTKRVIAVGVGATGVTATPASLTVNGGKISSSFKEVDGDETYHCAIAIRANYGEDHSSPSTAVACVATINKAEIDGGIYIFGQGAELNVNDGANIHTESTYAISGNGSKGNGQNQGDTVINITGGTITQTGTTGTAIYHPQNGLLNISGNPVISGATAIQLCSGEGVVANITGGTITGTGADSRSGKTGDGFISDGAAVSIVDRNYPGGTPKMNISGGNFISKQSVAVLAYTWNGTSSSDWQDAPQALEIIGGTFLQGDNEVSDVSAFVPAGMKQNEDGSIGFSDDAVASVNGKGYTTLADAITAAGSNGTVVLVKDEVELAQTIPEGVILEVPSGKTLKIETSNLSNLITSAGKIRVNANGVLNVGGTEMIGGSNANINLTKGYIDVSKEGTLGTDLALVLNFVGAEAEVPEGGRWTLSMNIPNNDPVPMNAALDNATILTVNATGTAGTAQNDGFRVAKESTLTNNGTIYVNGVMSISTTGSVEGSGTIQVSGILVNNQTAADVANTITLASGGKVYSQSDISDKLAGNKRTLSSTEYNGTEYQYAWKYYAKSGSSSGGGGGGGGGTPTYSNTVFETTNGNVTVSPKDALEDATVTITVKPDEGYVLDTLTVKDADGKTVEVTEKSETEYTFKMPASKVTISATFTEETAEVTTPFTDVAAGEYYYDAVLWAVENGITTGMTETTFGPNEDVSRAQMVTFLWRAAGSPEATGTNPFTDVAESDYYYDAVLWAVENGVTNGTSDTSFSPNAPVSRAQSVTFQWRAAGSPEASGDSFADVADDAYYADAVLWAVENEITNGMSETSFGPDVTVSRAQAVTFLYRAAN